MSPEARAPPTRLARPRKILKDRLQLFSVLSLLTDKTPPVAEPFCARTGGRKVPGLILGRPCRPNRSEFFVVLSVTRVNVG